MNYSDLDVSKGVSEQKVVRIVAHQLNTPLTAIKWSSELLAGPGMGELNEDQKMCVSDIRMAAERSIGLGRDLVALFHLYFKTPLESTSVATQALLQNILDDLYVSIAAKKLVLNTDIAPGATDLHGPLESFRLVMGAMLSNAVHYSAAGGAIGIWARPATAEETAAQALPADKGYIYFKVSDTGVGIPAGEQDKVFGPFFRATNVQQQHIEGEGLGLYIASLSLQQLVGKLWFDSEEGKGSNFYALIPIQPAQSAA